MPFENTDDLVPANNGIGDEGAPPQRAWSGPVQPIFVEVKRLGEDWQPDERLRFEQAVEGSDEVENSAVISVRLDEPVTGQTSRFGISEALAAYPVDTMIRIVRRDRVDQVGGEYFWQGVLDGPQEGGIAPNDQTFRLTARSMLANMAGLRYGWIYGRLMRSVSEHSADAIDDTDPTPQGTLSSLCDAFACVFNAGGKPNCHPVPLNISVAAMGGDMTVYVPLFTDDDAPNAVYWTPARALMYVAYFYLHEESLLDCWPIFNALMENRADIGGTLVQTAPLLAISTNAGPSVPATMLRRLDEFSPERMNMAEALIGLANAAGFKFFERTRNDPAQDGAVTELSVWVPGTGTLKDLNLEPAGTSVPSGSSGRDIWLGTKNNVNVLDVLRDGSSILNDPIIIGDVEYVLTRLALLPAWKPNEPLADPGDEADVNMARCDNLDTWQKRKTALEQVSGMAGLAGDRTALSTHAYLRNFHKAGTNRWRDENPLIGRVWVANEDRMLDPAVYGRTFGPYSATTYLEPSTEGGFSWEPSADAIPGMRYARKRVLRPLSRLFPFGTARMVDPLPPAIVEIELDEAGPVMRVEQNKVKLLADRIGVLLVDDLLTMVTGYGFDPVSDALLRYYQYIEDNQGATDHRNPNDADNPYPGPANLWEGLIEGRVNGPAIATARVFVTCLLPTDWRLISDPLPALFGGSALRRSRVFVREDFQKVNLDPVTPISTFEVPDRDDTMEVNNYAAAIAVENRDSRHGASVSIPWFERNYARGEQISGIPRRDISFASLVGVSAERYPEVVGIVHEMSEQSQATHLVLNDWRRFPDLMPEGIT